MSNPYTDAENYGNAKSPWDETVERLEDKIWDLEEENKKLKKQIKELRLRHKGGK